MGTKNKKK